MCAKHGADTTDAWLRQPIRLSRQYLGDVSSFQMVAPRVSIAETHSTFTISPSKARGVGYVEDELSAFLVCNMGAKYLIYIIYIKKIIICLGFFKLVLNF